MDNNKCFHKHYTEERSREDEGEDWSETATGQGSSAASNSWKRQEGFFPEAWEGAWSCYYFLDPGLLTFGTVRRKFFVVSHAVCGNLLPQSWKTNATLHEKTKGSALLESHPGLPTCPHMTSVLHHFSQHIRLTLCCLQTCEQILLHSSHAKIFVVFQPSMVLLISLSAWNSFCLEYTFLPYPFFYFVYCPLFRLQASLQMISLNSKMWLGVLTHTLF